MAARTRVNRNGEDAAASTSESLAVAAFRTSFPTRSSSSFLGLLDLNMGTSPAASVYRAHHQKTIKNCRKLQEFSPTFCLFHLQIALQHPAEIRPGPMRTHLHFGYRPIGDFSYFRHRKTFNVEQGQHQPIVRTQPGQQLRRQITRNELRLHVPGWGAHLRGKLLCLALFDIAKTLLRTAARAPEMIVATIDRDLRQPGLERSLMGPVVTAQRKVRFREAVLDDFLDLFALPKEATRDARNLTTMTFEQLLERSFVTGCSCGNQNIICRFRRFHFL